jgi:hypothetical protein
MIHKLQDLCYAYAVADPVREMLFALQDRITELEAQRKPLTATTIFNMMPITVPAEYDKAMQVLSEYRSAMNEIHEQHSPTFMGEPKV